MKRQSGKRRTAETLRENAESRLRSKGSRCVEVKGDAATIRLNNLRMAYELEVHQIELEMQHEELMALHDQADAAMEDFDFGPAGILTLHTDGQIRDINVVGGTMLGASRAALVGQRLTAMVALPEREAFGMFLSRIFETRSKQMLECTILRSDRTLLRAMIAARSSPDGQDCRAVMLDMGDRSSVPEKVEIRGHPAVGLPAISSTSQTARPLSVPALPPMLPGL